MKELHFKQNGSLMVAVEGPNRFVLRRDKSTWVAEIYERQGRRTPKLAAPFTTKAQAIDWMGRYRTEAA